MTFARMPHRVLAGLAGGVVLVGSLAYVRAQTLESGAGVAVGIARARIVSLSQPDQPARLLVRLAIARGESVDVWARLVVPIGGNESGLWALPDIGDEVVVTFEHGDLRRPYVIGSLWDGRPPR